MQDYDILIMFPSPCGDMVLKFYTKSIKTQKIILFPSPCGDMVLKLAKAAKDTGRSTEEFPSPCGDMVLK